MTNAVSALRRIRRERGFSSSRSLARALGVSHDTTSRWEISKGRPLPHHGWRLEALLGCTLDELLAPDNEKALDPSRGRALFRCRAQAAHRGCSPGVLRAAIRGAEAVGPWRFPSARSYRARRRAPSQGCGWTKTLVLVGCVEARILRWSWCGLPAMR